MANASKKLGSSAEVLVRVRAKILALIILCIPVVIER
jgi:hypothetical protein